MSARDLPDLAGGHDALDVWLVLVSVVTIVVGTRTGSLV